MKKGQSFISLSEDETPNDPLIKALKERNINKAEILFASMKSSNAGWEMVSSDKGCAWLGFTRRSAMDTIEKMSGNPKGWIDYDNDK